MFALINRKITGPCGAFLLPLLLAFLFACEPASKPEKPAAAEPVKKRKVMKIHVDMEAEQKSQDAADQGFRKWKNRAKDVAEECIIGKGIGAPSECEVLSETEKEATVRVVTKKDGAYKVKLEKLVRPGGIWTATEVEKEED